MEPFGETLSRRLGELVGPSPWLIAVEVGALVPRLAHQLEAIGLEPDVLGVCATPGIGDPHDYPIVTVDVAGDSLMDGLRRYLSAAAELPDAAVAEIDRWDPRRRARVLTAPFAALTSVAGRPVFGPRPYRYAELEDKMIADGIWDEAGIDRSPTEIHPCTSPEALEAAARLDQGAGTVWVGDNREGWHGGGEYVRWVTDGRSSARAQGWFAAHCDTVRIMPFLDGIPCSVHGFATPDGVAAFRPVEMLVLRRPRGDRETKNRFAYGGLSTTWDPPSAVRQEMREAALAVGALLRDRFEYQGAFGIDGVATEHGFRPTELNPRLTAGIGVQADPAGIPFGMLNRAVHAGHELAIDVAELEAAVIPQADEHRTARSFVPIDRVVVEQRSLDVWVREGRLVEEGDGKPDGAITIGPAVSGGIVRLEMNPDAVGIGRSFAPFVANAAGIADLRFGAGIGRLDPAPEKAI